MNFFVVLWPSLSKMSNTALIAVSWLVSCSYTPSRILRGSMSLKAGKVMRKNRIAEARSAFIIPTTPRDAGLFISNCLDDLIADGMLGWPPSSQERYHNYDRETDEDQHPGNIEWNGVSRQDHRHSVSHKFGSKHSGERPHGYTYNRNGDRFKQDQLAYLSAQPADRTNYANFTFTLGYGNHERIHDSEHRYNYGDHQLHVVEHEELINQAVHPLLEFHLSVDECVDRVGGEVLNLALGRDGIDARVERNEEEVDGIVMPALFVERAIDKDGAFLRAIIIENAKNRALERTVRSIQRERIPDMHLPARGEVSGDEHACASWKRVEEGFLALPFHGVDGASHETVHLDGYQGGTVAVIRDGCEADVFKPLHAGDAGDLLAELFVEMISGGSHNGGCGDKDIGV